LAAESGANPLAEAPTYGGVWRLLAEQRQLSDMAFDGIE
jgi:hypothetical protein